MDSDRDGADRLTSALRAVLPFLAFLGLAFTPPVSATNHLVEIGEIMAGANGQSDIQFIEMRPQAFGQNQWGPQFGETESRAMLVFFNASGVETGRFKFPFNAPDALSVLIATQGFKDAGFGTPDFIIPPLLSANSGKVCFKENPNNPVFDINICLSYGGFTGDTETDTAGQPFGPPAPALPITGTQSLASLAPGGGHDNADFVLTSTPSPLNGQNVQGVVGDAGRGQVLFTTEAFDGNGRTCASCHVLTRNLGLPPDDIQSRFAGIDVTFDPLFIAEPGFNLNTLTLASAATPGDLSGVITGTTGRGKVLTKVSATEYLIYGGIPPSELSGTVTDGANSAVVSSVVAGNLDELEDPARMRTSGDPAFPDGRGLILENIDGFANLPVFRKSPHLQNLIHTGPYGFSNNISSLTDIVDSNGNVLEEGFATGAVKQHFPRRIERALGIDFRLPTRQEQADMAAFMVSAGVPAGSGAAQFNVDLFATTSAQRAGRAAFFNNTNTPGAGRCIQCHEPPVFAGPAFNTGVTEQAINVSTDNLPPEPAAGGRPSTRAFGTPSLFNVAANGPFFHDNSVPDLAGVMDFFTSPTFSNSPAALQFGINLNLTAGQKSDLVKFMEALAVRPYTVTPTPNVTTPLVFLTQDPGAGPTPSQQVTITNPGPAAVAFAGCELTGTNPADFVIVSCPPGAIAAGTSRNIDVAFDPDAAGFRSAVLELLADLPSGIGLVGSQPTVNFALSSSSVLEGGVATVTAQLSEPTTLAVTVPFSLVAPTTATAAQDFNLTASPLTIPAGQTSASITVSTVNELIVEDDETVTIRIGTPINAVRGSPFTHTVTITDDDTLVFSFVDGTGVEPNTARTSNAVTIGPIEVDATVSVIGGSYSIGCTGNFVTTDGTLGDGQAICVRHVSSANFSTPTNTVLTVALAVRSFSDTFTSTTRAGDSTPDAFMFTDQSDVEPSTPVVSNAQTITGIELAAISVSGGQYSVNNGAFTATPGAVINGDSVRVRHTSSSAFTTPTNTVLTVGGVSDTFTSTTRAAKSGGGGGGMGSSVLALLLLALAGRRSHRHRRAR
jgi:hypothetical protein